MSLNFSWNENFFRQNVERIKTIFFRKSRRLQDHVEKYCTAGQATDNNMAHARCMLDS
jgi:hypothetical protein